MTMEEYFGMIINILKGLTLIVILMIFLYMIFGERGRGGTSRSHSFLIYASRISSYLMWGLYAFL